MSNSGALVRRATAVDVDAMSCSPRLRVSVVRYERIRRQRGFKPVIGRSSRLEPWSESDVRSALKSGTFVVALNFERKRASFDSSIGSGEVGISINGDQVRVDANGQIVIIDDNPVLLSAPSTGIYRRFAVLEACSGKVTLVQMRMARLNHGTVSDYTFRRNSVRLLNDHQLLEYLNEY